MPLTEDEPAQDPSPNEEDNEGVKPPKEAGGGKPVDEKNPPPPKPTTDCDALERKLFALQGEWNAENDAIKNSNIQRKIDAVKAECLEKNCNCH